MNPKSIIFNKEKKTIIIEGMSHQDTIEALEYLSQNHFIDFSDYTCASFICTSRWGPKLEITSEYSNIPYNTITIKTINFKKTNSSLKDFNDIECGVKILKMFGLYIFESIETILKANKDKYIYNGYYNIWVNKNGTFFVKTKYSGFFIQD